MQQTLKKTEEIGPIQKCGVGEKGAWNIGGERPILSERERESKRGIIDSFYTERP